MSKILVFGANGQVGSALKNLIGRAGIFLDSNDADLSRPNEILAALSKHQPTTVINAAAYTAVDEAEDHRDLAFKINGEAPRIMASWCTSNEVPFVHYSTDYVFNGTGTMPWKENDTPDPINVYGESKLEGECQVRKAGGQHIIFRTSWVYSYVGHNFVKTMLNLGAERESLSIVDDQIGSPTYAPDIAAATIAALKHPQAATGVFNLTNSGWTSWFLFAKEIFEIGANAGFPLKIKEVLPTKTKDFPRPAPRPLNSRLSSEKLNHTLSLKLRPWQEALQECLEHLRGKP